MAIENAWSLASASHNNHLSYLLADHNTGTQWTSGNPQTTSMWVAFNLIVPRALEEIILRCTGVGSDYPRSWDIEASTTGVYGGEQTVVASGSATGAGDLSTPIPTSTEYQYWRVRITTAVGNHLKINEVELKSEELTLIDPVGSVAVSAASASHNNADAGNLIDGNFANQWRSNAAQTAGMWTTFDLGADEPIGAVELHCVAGDGFSTDFPRHWAIYGSTTGSFGGEQVLVGVSATGAAGVLTTRVVVTTAYRYWRVVILQPVGNHWRMNEVVLLGAGAPPADPPGTPVIFAAATGTTEVTVTHSTPGANADTHDLYAADDPADLELPIDPGFLLAADSGPEPDPVVDTGLDPGSTRYYRSIASNTEGETASAIVSAMTPEVGPVRPSVTVPAKTDTFALLRSSDFAHSDGDVTIAAIEFRVATGTDPDTYVYSSDILAASGDVTTWRDHGVEDLTVATSYNAFVRHWGTDGVASEWSLPTAFTTDADPPPVVDEPEITVEEQPGAFEWYYGASVEVEASVPHDPAIVLYQWFLFAGTEASPGPLLAWTYSTSRIWRAVVYEGPGTYHVRVSPNLNAGPVADFSVGSRVLAPRITAPDGQAVELGATIDIEWAALWGAPSGALVDIEVRASGGAWSEVATGLDADDGEYEWDISALPPGFYQLRIRMRTDTETSRWRTGYVLTIGEIPNLVEAPGDSLEDYEEGGVTGGVTWSADPIRSTLVVPNSQTHWQKYLPTGQPRDVEITAQAQSRAWHPSTYWAWQFNAIRHVGVGAQLAGTHESDEGALTGIWALLTGGGWAVPLDATFNGARSMDRIYGRGAASVALTRKGDGSGGGGATVGHIHQWRPDPNPITGVIVDPWYQVRIRLTTTAVHESGTRDYRARVQVAGPDIEPDGPDDWQIDTTLSGVDIDCGEAGLVAWMANHLNPDVQALFRAVRIIPLDYGDCGPPLPLILHVATICGDLLITGAGALGDPVFTSADLQIRLDDGTVIYTDFGNTPARWFFQHGAHGLPYDTPLEARIKRSSESEWSEWSAPFTIHWDILVCAGRPCSLYLICYEHDRETMAWMVSTDPDGTAPQYLMEPDRYGEQELDFVEGRASIAEVVVSVIDPAQIPGDQDSGFMTERLADELARGAVTGRRMQLIRYVDDETPPVVIADGPAGAPIMRASYAAFDIGIRDTRETERKMRAFVSGGTSSMLPMGVLTGYGWDGTDWLVPPTDPLTGFFSQANNQPLGMGGYDIIPSPTTGFVSMTGSPSTITLDILNRFQASSIEETGVFSFDSGGNPVPFGDGSTFRTEFHFRSEFAGFEIRWRPVGGYDDDWIVIQRPIMEWVMHEEVGEGNTGFWGGVVNAQSAPPDVVGLFIGADNLALLPADNEEIEFAVVYAGPPSEDYPFHLEGMTLGELLIDLYDGVYSSRGMNGEIVSTGIRYDPIALLQLTQPVRARITEPVKDLRRFTEDMGFGPVGYAPALDNLALISPMSSVPPPLGELTEINNAIAAIRPSWNAGERIVNIVRFSYLRHYPDVASTAVDGLSAREVIVEYIANEDSLSAHGEQVAEYDGMLFSAIGDADGMRTEAAEVGDELARIRGTSLRARYGFGAPVTTLPVMRDFTAHLRAGDWCVIDISWLPDYVTARRGLLALVQITAIADLNCAWRELTMEVVAEDDFGS